MLQKLFLFIKFHLLTKPYNSPVRDTKFNIPLVNPVDIKTLLEGVECKVVESIVFQNQNYPIYEINISNGSKKVLIVSGIHGNEQSGVLCLPKLVDRIKKLDNLEKLNIKIISPVNPVGYEFESRYNSKGFDINRDFVKLETKEAKLLKSYIDNFEPEWIIDMHEGPHQGTFIYCNNFISQQIGKQIVSTMETIGVDLASKSYLGNKLKIPGYFPVIGFWLFVQNLWRIVFKISSLGMFARSEGIKSITIEVSWNMLLAKKIDSQVKTILSIIKNIH